MPCRWGNRVLWRSLALIAFWGLCPTASARRVDAALYPYPYQDPYLASTTVAILKDRDQRYVWSEAQALELELIPGRNQVPLLEGKGKLHTRYLPQPGPAPLIVLLPGFGGSAYSGSARYVAQLFQDHGFQVLSLPSPFHWNFALAASRSALPGLTERDSAELYRAIQAALDQIRRRYHAEITTIGLIGLSHGALVAGYLSKLDAEERRVGFGTTLLVNPHRPPHHPPHHRPFGRCGAPLSGGRPGQPPSLCVRCRQGRARPGHRRP